MSKLIIKNSYAVTPNNLLNNKKISLKSKGLFAFLQSKPSNWDFTKEKIVKQTKEGMSSIKSAIKELKKYGYLETTPIKDEKGQWNGYNYKLNDKPAVVKTHGAKNAPSVNRAAISKQELSKQELSKQELSKQELSKDISKEMEARPQYGREDINEIVTFLKENNNNMIDGTIKSNRYYAKLLIDKIKKAYPNENTVIQIKAIIQTAMNDEFHSKNTTSFKYLYNNAQKIIQIIKARTNNLIKV